MLMTDLTMIKHDIMPFVHARTFNSMLSQCTHNHLRMLVSREVCRRRYHTPIDVALVVEDSASSGTTTHQLNVSKEPLRSLLAVIE